jgi:hypothetical protein
MVQYFFSKFDFQCHRSSDCLLPLFVTNSDVLEVIVFCKGAALDLRVCHLGL